MGNYVLLHPFTDSYDYPQAEIRVMYYPEFIESLVGARDQQLEFVRAGFRKWNYVAGKAVCSRKLSRALEECLKRGRSKAPLFHA